MWLFPTSVSPNVFPGSLRTAVECYSIGRVLSAVKIAWITSAFDCTYYDSAAPGIIFRLNYAFSPCPSENFQTYSAFRWHQCYGNWDFTVPFLLLLPFAMTAGIPVHLSGLALDLGGCEPHTRLLALPGELKHLQSARISQRNKRIPPAYRRRWALPAAHLEGARTLEVHF